MASPVSAACEAANLTGPSLSAHSYSLVVVVGVVLAVVAALTVVLAMIRYCCCRGDRPLGPSEVLGPIPASSRPIEAAPRRSVRRALLPGDPGEIPRENEVEPCDQSSD
jgi:hypothetical protein